ncbi:MAG: helix-turn-helix domain-containing protein [Sedimentisphaerales bacterium]|nr:helix-turn-helix domain-containing protein [Sedimentisphaerales bacterium]
MNKDKYFTIPQLAEMLGISRIAVYKKVKNKQIKAEKIGKNYAIPLHEIASIFGNVLRKKDKDEIDQAVKRTVKEYGNTLKLLGSQ